MLRAFNVLECFVWVVIIVASVYWYFTRNHGYWKKRGIPYIKPWPFIGSVILDTTKTVHETELERYNKYGRIYGLFEGNQPVLTVGEPELVKNILLKDFHSFPIRRIMKLNDIREYMMGSKSGKDWKRIRTIVTPTFSTGKLKRLLNIFDECAETLSINFMKAAKEGNTITAKVLLGAYSLDAIASSAFSTKLDSHNDPSNKFVGVAKQAFNNEPNWKFVLRILFPILSRSLGISFIEKRATKFFADVSHQIIQERTRTGQTRNDFLQLLLDACKDVEQESPESSGVTEKYDKEGNGEQIINNEGKNKSLSMNEILAQCANSFITAYGTVPTILSLCMYEIAMETEVQDKLLNEIDKSFEESKGILTYEAIQNMKYMDNIISETMRLYPPVYRLQRIAAEDYVLGKTGITIPRGMKVEVPVYAIHRDSEYYPDPDKFDPDRFDEPKPAFTYLPFGGGPRNCVAKRFAMLEMKVCLARILSRFRLRIDPNMKVPLQFDYTTFLLEPKDILLRLEIRNVQRHPEQ